MVADKKNSDENLEDFATRSRDLWLRYTAQGSRSGKKGSKGIRAKLKDLGIPEKAARKAIRELFPNFFTLTPAQKAAREKGRAAKAKRRA